MSAATESKLRSRPKYLPHYTVEDYGQWKGDWELWDGIPIAMTPSPFGVHQAVARRLTVELAQAIETAGCDAEVLYEINWIISDDMVVRPDVLVLCGEVPERHVMQTPALVAEILSPTSRELDLRYKRQLYLDHSVENYLIVDPDAETLHLVRRESEGKVTEQEVGDEIEPMLCGECRIRIARAPLFRRQGGAQR